MNKLSDHILKEYPGFIEACEAIGKFKKTGKEIIKCSKCNNIIKIIEVKELGVLETSCICGYTKTRSRRKIHSLER